MQREKFAYTHFAPSIVEHFFYENSKWKRFKIVKIFNTVYLNIVSVRKLELRLRDVARAREGVQIPIRSSYIPGEYHQSSAQIQIAARTLARLLAHI